MVLARSHAEILESVQHRQPTHKQNYRRCGGGSRAVIVPRAEIVVEVKIIKRRREDRRLALCELDALRALLLRAQHETFLERSQRRRQLLRPTLRLEGGDSQERISSVARVPQRKVAAHSRPWREGVEGIADREHGQALRSR